MKKIILALAVLATVAMNKTQAFKIDPNKFLDPKSFGINKEFNEIMGIEPINFGSQTTQPLTN